MARQKNDGRGRLGGRAKGTPNKVTVERRALIASFIESRWEEFIANYDAIKDPQKKCDIFMSMMGYYAPKLSSVEYKEQAPPKTYKDELDELSQEKTR